MVRAIALIGVVVMNYHGYLIGVSGAAATANNFAERLFNPWTGVLSTRFAATFTMVAGIGVTLLTRRSVASGDREQRRADRWRLRRRGLLLFAVGYSFDWVWGGTILPYYGLFFLIASFLFSLRARWLVVGASAVAVLAPALQFWSLHRQRAGGLRLWFLVYERQGYRSHRDLVASYLFNGTHPPVPWLVFLIGGMLIGRALPRLAQLRWRLIGAGTGLVAVGYLASTLLREAAQRRTGDAAAYLRAAAATDPNSRQFLYVMTTLGSSIVAVVVISQVAERFAGSRPVRLLAHAGQMSLTLYVLHALLFNEVVNLRHWIRPTGLDTALVFAGGYWVAAIIVGAAWHRWLGAGPLERLYRHFGG